MVKVLAANAYHLCGQLTYSLIVLCLLSAPAVAKEGGKPHWLASAEVRTGTAPCKALKPKAGLWRASWYSEGRFTADGRRYDREKLSAAHPRFAFGTKLKICHGKHCAVVVVNDRGPAKWTGCHIDVSLGAARVLRFLHEGVALVSVEKMPSTTVAQIHPKSMDKVTSTSSKVTAAKKVMVARR